MHCNSTIVGAANLRIGDNPPYTVEDFLALYPQFKGNVPDSFLEMYLNLADSSLSYQRYFDAWPMVMGLFVAHFCTLYLQSAVDADSSTEEITQAGQAVGLVSSESVGPLSTSYDFSNALSGMEAWGGWTTTAFGLQLATMAKLYGKGGMVIW